MTSFLYVLYILSLHLSLFHFYLIFICSVKYMCRVKYMCSTPLFGGSSARYSSAIYWNSYVFLYLIIFPLCQLIANVLEGY